MLCTYVCRENALGVVISISPYFDECFGEKFVRIIKDVADRYGIPVINFSRLKGISGNGEYFVDRSHLNYEGARKFTMVFCKRIKETGIVNSGIAGRMADVKDR